MDLYTEAKVSPAGKVNREDLKKWATNILLFLVPLALLYLQQLNVGIQDGFLDWSDLRPSLVTLGGMELYVLNAVTDLIRKFADGKK